MHYAPSRYLRWVTCQFRASSNDLSSFHLKLLIKDFYVLHLFAGPHQKWTIQAILEHYRENSKVVGQQHNFAMCACMKLFALRRYYHTGFFLVRWVLVIWSGKCIFHRWLLFSILSNIYPRNKEIIFRIFHKLLKKLFETSIKYKIVDSSQKSTIFTYGIVQTKTKPEFYDSQWSRCVMVFRSTLR